MNNNKSALTGHSTSRAKNLMGGLSRAFLNGLITAKRVVIPASDIESETEVHPLNPRNQEALNNDAVRDILQSIIDNGVNQEGIAVRCANTGKLLLLDASRRRYSCIVGGVDLPLWVIEPTSDENLLKIINDSQEVKRWSYPEHATYLLKIAERKNLPSDLPIAELAKELGMGRESLRKRLEANSIDNELRKVFIDFEGIPNSYYSELAKIQKKLIKNNVTISQFIENVKNQIPDFNGSDLDVCEHQKITLNEMKLLASSTQEKPKWVTSKLSDFENKKAYAKVSKSPDGNAVKYEFSRIGAAKLKKIDEFIESVFNEE